MSKKNLKAIGAIAAVGGAVVGIHGITSKRWQVAHAVFTVIGILVATVSVWEEVDAALQRSVGHPS